MKVVKFQPLKPLKIIVKILTNLTFAIFLLIFIAIVSSFGSIIEQNESLDYYQQNYPSTRPIFAFIDSKFILSFGLDHLYTTWWFFSLLLLLALSLISCTITRQFPSFFNSKEYFFKTQKNLYIDLPFFVKIQNIPYLKEIAILKIQTLNFYTFHKGNKIYGYKGLIGRISPVLVHFSLILVLTGSILGAFNSFKAQEILSKGSFFRIQNTIRLGSWTPLPSFSFRVNDFWVEYQTNKIRQFYSNLSVLDSYGNEIKQQTISVNNPLRYKQLDFYQSDWNLSGIRLRTNNIISEFPLFSLKNQSKSWITWVVTDLDQLNRYTVIFDQFQNVFLLYDEQGRFLGLKNIGDFISFSNFRILEILPSTGLLVKYDPSISLIYFGFALLMLTSSLSYLPYTQIWLFFDNKNFKTLWLGSATNRGKIQVQIDFENLIRYLEKALRNSSYFIL